MSARGAIFDMDGVLVDSGAHHRAAWRALLDELGERPAHDEPWRLTIGRPGAEAVPLLLGRRVAEGEARALARRKRAHYVRLARAGVVAIPGAPAFVEALAPPPAAPPSSGRSPPAGSRARSPPPPRATTPPASSPGSGSCGTSRWSSPRRTCGGARPIRRCTCSPRVLR